MAHSGNCQKCDISFSYLERDHIVPRHLGGTDDESNLQWLCPNCHTLKTIAEKKALRRTPEQNAAMSELMKGNQYAKGLKFSDAAKRILGIKGKEGAQAWWDSATPEEREAHRQSSRKGKHGNS